MTSDRQRVQEYIERTYLPGELFTVYQIAEALDQWKPRPQSKRLSAQSVERPVRAMLKEGLLWRFLAVEWRDKRHDERDVWPCLPRNEPPTAWLRGLGWMRMTASPGDVVLAVVPGWSPIMSLT